MSLASSVTGLFTSRGLRRMRHTLGNLERTLRRQPPTAHYFHQIDDPYSHLLLQALSTLLVRYPVDVTLHLVSPPSDSAAPDRARLQAWSRRDAAEIANFHHLSFVDPGKQPDAALCAQALAAMVASFKTDDFAESLTQWQSISTRLWAGDPLTLNALPSATRDTVTAALSAGDDLRMRRGHYLGGMIFFEGEWYWGIDRLHHLETRWNAMGLSRQTNAVLQYFAPGLALPPVSKFAKPPVLDFFCSLRSPYTYLAIDRCTQLADHYGAELRLRFVLPMVMRGLPVPRAKRMYIVLDSKREADDLGLPFGRIADPVGKPTEHGLAVLHHAIAAGKGVTFLRSFMQGVWAEGIDAGSAAGLRQIAERAGLDGHFVTHALADDAWRGVAQANREEMLAAGLWGVPSFRVNGGPARWGQDRLWLVEKDIQAIGTSAP